MTHFIPRYFILLSWLLVGPSKPNLLFVGLIAMTVVAALALRRSFRGQTIALLGIFGLMLSESLFLVLLTLHLDLLDNHVVRADWSPLFQTLRALDLGVVLAGALAAGCAALFIEFGKSRVSLSKAFPHTKFLDTPSEIQETVSRIARIARITVPDVLLVDSGIPSAFTVRANRKYSVTVSVGLLEALEKMEVEACLAHEIAHLKNKDFAVRFLATLSKVALFARPLSYLVEPAIYRAREFLADRTAANLIGGPNALVSALSKLKESSFVDSALPSSACLCNLNGRKGLLRMFDKHPDLDTRVKMLMEMK